MFCFVSCCTAFCGSGCGATVPGGRSKRSSPHSHQLLRGESKTFPSQLRNIISPARPWSVPGSPPGWGMPKTPPRGRRPEGILTRCLKHLDWLLSTRRSSSSTLCFLLYTSTAERSHAAKETYFGRLYSRSHSFEHYPEVITTDDSWEVDYLLYLSSDSATSFTTHIALAST